MGKEFLHEVVKRRQGGSPFRDSVSDYIDRELQRLRLQRDMDQFSTTLSTQTYSYATTTATGPARSIRNYRPADSSPNTHSFASSPVHWSIDFGNIPQFRVTNVIVNSNPDDYHGMQEQAVQDAWILLTAHDCVPVYNYLGRNPDGYGHNYQCTRCSDILSPMQEWERDLRGRR